MLRSKKMAELALAAVNRAKQLAQTAETEGRELSAEESEQYKSAMAEAAQRHADAKQAREDEQILADAEKMAEELGLGQSVKDDVAAQGHVRTAAEQGKSLAQTVLESAQFKALQKSFPGGRVPEGMRVHTDPIPVKSLFTGSNDLSGGAFVVSEQSGIVEMLGRREFKLRDLISVRRTTSDTIEYVAQTSHTNAAAPVAEATSSAAPTAPGTAGALVLDADGGYKPEGAWAFERRSTVVRTIAEWVPATKRALADVAQLEGLIRDELRVDIQEAEETQIVSGSGTGENLRGILNVSGIQTQAATTTNDATWFASFRTAVTKIRTVGRTIPNAILVNPAQGEKIDTAKDAQNRFYGNGPFGVAPRTLWGYPVVESEAITAGTALVGDFSKAVLWDREQTTVTMTDSHADFFIRNMVAILAEERVAFAVTRPTAFCTVTGL